MSQRIQEYPENLLHEVSKNLDILIGPSRLIFVYASRAKNILQITPEENRLALLSFWAGQVKRGKDAFSALQGLAMLVDLAQRTTPISIHDGQEEKPLRDWISDHLLHLLLDRATQQTSERIDPLQNQQPLADRSSQSLKYSSRDLQGSIHARVLRLIFRAVASPTHISELEASHLKANGRDICRDLLMRGIVLTHRLLPVILEDIKLSSDGLEQKLTEAETKLVSVWGGLGFTDQFCPELYGPAEDQYDHLLAGALAIFCEVGLSHDADTVKPFWLTPAVKRGLIALANRPENEAERSIRELREQGAPNRLQTFLDKTPQEYAAEILRLTSPEQTNEENLIIKARDKLLDLLSPATDALEIDIEASTGNSGRPDMIARAKTGERENDSH